VPQAGEALLDFRETLLDKRLDVGASRRFSDLRAEQRSNVVESEAD
jgi:hypothetical protein